MQHCVPYACQKASKLDEGLISREQGLVGVLKRPLGVFHSIFADTRPSRD